MVAVKREQRLRVAEGPAAAPLPDGDLAGALHEVSNALTVVLGWLQHAQRHLADGAGAEALEIARSHAALGHSIARRAVGATTNESSELRSGRALAEEAVLGVCPEADRRRVAVKVDGPGGGELLPGPAAIHQILLNLLLNAIAFTPEGEAVVVTVIDEPAAVLFRVRDSGPGVPEDQRDHLFSSGPSRRPGGAGIGLSYSHRVAEQNGGALALMPGGGGACFELRWPILRGATPAPPVAVPRPPKMLDGLRVAVLEDDGDVMGMLELGLCSRGVTLYQLADRAALEEFSDNGGTVDAALIDLSPIASDPQGAIDRLRKNSPRVQVFLISGTVISTDAGPNIAGWIRKPFDLGEVYQALGQVIPG